MDLVASGRVDAKALVTHSFPLEESHAAFELVAEQVMQPFFKELAEKLRPFMPKDLDAEQLLLRIWSVFAMVLHFNFARVAITRITGRQYDPAFKAQLVEHIVEFSLTGIGAKEKGVGR